MLCATTIQFLQVVGQLHVNARLERTVVSFCPTTVVALGVSVSWSWVSCSAGSCCIFLFVFIYKPIAVPPQPPLRTAPAMEISTMVRVFQQGGFRCTLRRKRCLAPIRGRQCARVGYHIPFCLQHARVHMGVDVRASTIPGAGLGLFARRAHRKGDVIGPYTGERFRNVTELQTARGGVIPVYAYRGHGGWVVDASCERGLLAYVNEATGRGRRNNLTGREQTIRWGPHGNHRKLFGPADPVSGLCPVLPRSACGRRNRFWETGWRRIPAVFLRPPFVNTGYLWLAVTRDVPASTELLWSYRSGGVHRSVTHKTLPVLV